MQAFGSIFELHNPILVNFLLRFNNYNLPQSEDMASDIWIKIYDNLNKFNTELSFKSWMFRIAHNHAIDIIRKNKKIYFYFNDSDLDKIQNQVFENQEKIANKLLLEQILSKLNPLEREMIELSCLEDLSLDELSDVFRLSKRQISVKLYKIKNKLKKLINLNEKQ